MSNYHRDFEKRHEVKKSREVGSHQTGVVVARHIQRVEIHVIYVVVKQLHSPEIYLQFTIIS